jgi:hypothetical protein
VSLYLVPYHHAYPHHHTLIQPVKIFATGAINRVSVIYTVARLPSFPQIPLSTLRFRHALPHLCTPPYHPANHIIYSSLLLYSALYIHFISHHYTAYHSHYPTNPYSPVIHRSAAPPCFALQPPSGYVLLFIRVSAKRITQLLQTEYAAHFSGLLLQEEYATVRNTCQGVQ